MSFQTSEQAKAWLTIASVPRITPSEWLSLISQYASLEDTLAHAPAHNDEIRRHLNNGNLAWVERAEKWLAQDPVHSLLCFEDAAYPAHLKLLANPPLVLFVAGNLARLTLPQVAIVGSRRASHAGKQTAMSFASQLSLAGVAVTSGLAVGIDAAAHRGALDSGMTIAVMGTGPDTIYPPRNRSLYQDIIASGGVVISEFFPGVGPRPYHFPRRNRIIAAMTLATLVVEATIKSGTLITANLAADLGKDVFAVPGSIHHTYASGCHHLIQQGAMLVTCCDDILESLGLEPGSASPEEQVREQKSEVNCLATDKLLASVNFDVTAIDVIAERSALPVHEVMATLLEYELRGWVATVPGGYIKLRGK